MTASEHYSKSSKNKAYLELDEVARLEKSPTNLRDRLLIRLLFHQGCHVSEALALKVDDIGFTQGTITIIHLKTRLKLSCTQCRQGVGRSHRFCPKCGGKMRRLYFMAIDTVGANSLISAKKEGGQMQAYCMKCRTKREMKNTKSITMKNGRPATQGVCQVCGTKMFKIGKS